MYYIKIFFCFYLLYWVFVIKRLNPYPATISADLVCGRGTQN